MFQSQLQQIVFRSARHASNILKKRHLGNLRFGRHANETLWYLLPHKNCPFSTLWNARMQTQFFTNSSLRCSSHFVSIASFCLCFQCHNGLLCFLTFWDSCRQFRCVNHNFAIQYFHYETPRYTCTHLTVWQLPNKYIKRYSSNLSINLDQKEIVFIMWVPLISYKSI